MRMRLLVSGFRRWNEMSLVRVVALKRATGQLTSERRKLPCHTGRVGRLRVPGSFSFEGFDAWLLLGAGFFFDFAMMGPGFGFPRGTGARHGSFWGQRVR